MKIHMIGIGGIGMSALAQLYLYEKNVVTGSDREASPTTDLLLKKGIEVRIGQRAENVSADTGLVVYSDAVPEENSERVRAKKLEIRQISYFQALGEASKGKRTVAISGTHGKTTTTAMLAKILFDAGKMPTAIVGSIVPEFGSNFIPGKSDVFVIEACEYRDHLLELAPMILVITNIEWDHTDWFPSLSALQSMFGKAVHALPAHGALIVNSHDANVSSVILNPKCKVINYSEIEVPHLQLVGEFNRMNARAAAAAARALFPDISEESIRGSLSSFKGTWRRFEIKGRAPTGALVIDDYAHHPTAIQKTLRAAREKFPDKKILVAFHPHLYTRTRDLMEEFTGAFTDADTVLLAPIYAAREEPIEGITSEALAAAILDRGGQAEAFQSLSEVEGRLRELSSPESILITMGAGDIYKIADALVKL
jgi:UDP-N-acetylmuramate--alanine ligase